LTDKIIFITLGPAGAGGRPAGAGGRPAGAGGRPAGAGGRPAGGGRLVGIGGGRDEAGLQYSLYLVGRDAGDLQRSFKVSPDRGTDELERRREMIKFLWPVL